MGYEEAGKRVMDIRYGGNSQFANELNAIYQLPVYKYTEQIKKIRDNSDYNWGQLLITDLVGNPLYCIQDNYNIEPKGAKHGVVELECYNDYWLQYVKGKWSQVPKRGNYRRIRFNLDKVIFYKLDKYSPTETPFKGTQLDWAISPKYGQYVNPVLGVDDGTWEEYKKLVFSVCLKEYYNNRNIATQDMRDAFPDLWWFFSELKESSTEKRLLMIALLKAMCDCGIEQAIEKYEVLLLESPNYIKAHGTD